MAKIKRGVINYRANIEYSSSHGNRLEKAHASDSGYDIMAGCLSAVTIEPGEVKSIDTGIRLNLPKDWEGQIRPRSGLAKNYQITIMNSPGTIDSQYRGEIKILLFNAGKEQFTVQPRAKIAQIVFSPVWDTEIVLVTDNLIDKNTERSEKGFGSTEKTEKKP